MSEAPSSSPFSTLRECERRNVSGFHPPMHSMAEQRREVVRLVGLIGGPLLAAAVYLALPLQYVGWGEGAEAVAFSVAGRVTVGLMVWMAVWWVTEAIDIAATALLPLLVLPLSGAATMEEAAAPYASPIVFLIAGGFILAMSMQKWGLDRRVALLTLRVVGDRPANIVGGVMLATAMMSGFMSNSALAAILLPVGLSLIEVLKSRTGESSSRQSANFAVCVLLAIAYTCSIAGVSTLIGTPPNAFLAAFVREQIAEPYRRDISFATWMLVGVPIVVVFLPITWLLLTRVLFPIDNRPAPGVREFIRDSYASLGPMCRGERCTLAVFGVTALAWVFRPLLNGVPGLSGLTDAGIGVLAAMLLFVVPAGGGSSRKVMDWATASRIPWGVLVLFGGGLSLAGSIEANGVAEFIAAHVGALRGVPPIVLLVVVAGSVVFFSEIASNTATATTVIPILAAMAPALDVHPYFLIVPAMLAASFAFMLPAGTPPNAMVFGTGHVTIQQMCRAGIWLNLIGIVVIVLATYLLVLPVLT